MKYLVVIEKGGSSWGAHVPDLPGCVAAADTREEVVGLIREAIAFHLEDMRDNGEDIPQPSSEGELIEVGAA
jgi:predicted RNase H-like HicB family nuclease